MLPRIPGTSVSESNGLLPHASATGEDDDGFSYGGADETTDAPSVETTRANSTTELETSDNENNNTDNQALSIAQVASRLRCLFAVITWPIVPLSFLVVVALVYMIFTAGTHRAPCSHPLDWYAAVSLVAAVYTPNHGSVRARLVRRWAQRPSAVSAVRCHDQLISAVAIAYVYSGITLVRTCQQDVIASNSNDSTTSTCAATCPALWTSVSVYVTLLSFLLISIAVPLCCLPCIYLWFLRQATTDAETLAVLQERLQEESQLFRNGGVTVQELYDQLKHVQLIRARDDQRVMILPMESDNTFSEAQDSRGIKECCICMSDFVVTELDEAAVFGDIETAEPPSESETCNTTVDPQAIVQTNCGHLFHKRCMASWLGGRWQSSSLSNADETTDQRRARRTSCPLCRQDLRHPSL
jgi:hypothetical protein